MADEESAGGIEAVIKVTLDDSGIESEAQAAIQKAQSATKGKKAKVKVEVTVDPAQVDEAVSKATKGKKTVVKVKPTVDDADISALKQRFNLAADALKQAQQRVGDVSAPKDERAYLRAAIPKLQALVDDIPKAIAAREGRKAPAPSAPVTQERVSDVARQVAAAQRGRPVERPAPASAQPAPVIVVAPGRAPTRTGKTVRPPAAHGSGPGAIAQLLNQLKPTFAAFEPESPEIAALNAYYAEQDKAQGRERAARVAANPLAGLARATARVPMERTYRRGRLAPVREAGGVISGPTTPPFMEGNPVLGISPVYEEGEDPRVASPGFAGRRRSRRDPLKTTPNRGRIFTQDAAAVLPGELATDEDQDRYRRNRRRLEQNARRGEAPATEDTVNPIGEKVRAKYPRYTQAPIAAGEDFGAPGARGSSGKRPGEQVPLPRGDLGQLLRRFQTGQYEDYFQPMDETGRPLGPAERATGTLAERVRLDDPKYEQFRHEDRYLQRVSPKNIAAMEREQYLEQLEKQTGIPKLGLAGLGPLGSGRYPRRKITIAQNVAENPELGGLPLKELKNAPRRYETESETETRRIKTEKDRQRIASRTKEDLIRFNMHLAASTSGEGLAGPTGYINTSHDVQTLPEGMSDSDLRALAKFSPADLSGIYSTRADRSVHGGVAGAKYEEARAIRLRTANPAAQGRIATAAGMTPIGVYDPTAPGATKSLTDTPKNLADSRLSRDVLDVVNPRMTEILERYKSGSTMHDIGPTGQEADAEGKGGSPPVLRGPGHSLTRLSPERTALHRINQLIYDITKQAGYSETAARSYQTGRLKIGAAKKLDVGVRTYLSSNRESMYRQIGAGREAAEALDPLQRDPTARGTKQKAYTPQDEPLAKLEERLGEIGLRRDALSKTQEFKYDKEGNKTGSPEDVAAANKEDAELKKEQAKLRKQRLALRAEQEASYAAIQAQTGGKMLGQRGGIRGFIDRDRTRTKVVRGRSVRAPGQEYLDEKGMQGPPRLIEEVVPGRGRHQFTEGRVDSGDIYNQAVADAARTEALTTLGPTEESAAEPIIPLSKLKGKKRYTLQDSRVGGKRAGPAGPDPRGYIVSDATPPPGEPPAPPSRGSSPMWSGGVVRVFVVGGKLDSIGSVTAAVARAAKPTKAGAAFLNEETEARLTAKAPAGYAPVGKTFFSPPDLRTPAQKEYARRADAAEEKELKNANRANVAEEKAARLTGKGPDTAPAITQTRLLGQLRKQGINLPDVEVERRPFEGKSPARIAAEAEILQARALNPTRAFQTAVAAAFAKTIGGGGAFEQRTKGLTQALNARADAAESVEDTGRQLKAVRTRLNDAADRAKEMADAGKPIPKALVDYEENLQNQRKGLIETAAAQRATRQTAGETVEQRRRGLITPLGVARGFGALAAGAIVGGLAFGAAQQAVQAAIGLLTEQATRAADAVGGFGLTAAKVASELAGAVRQASGNVSGAVAGAAAPSGISAEALQGLNAKGLSDRAQSIAAAQARVEESDLFRSANFLGGDKLPGGYDKALFQGTGGILNTQLLAPQPGFLERVADDFNSFRSQAPVKNPNYDPLAQFFRPITGDQEQQPFTTEAPVSQREQRTDEYVRDLNSQLGRANSSFKYLTKATDEQKAAMLDSAAKLGQTEIAQKLIDAGVTIVGKGGQGLVGTEFGQAAADLSRGQLIPDQRVAFEADKRSLQAQMNEIQRESKYQLGTEIPRSLALSNLAAPAADVVGGQVQPTGLTAQRGKGGAAEQQQINAYIKNSQGQQNQLNESYAQGEAILKQQLKDASGSDALFDSIKSTGEQIASIQAGIVNAQGKLQTHEYDNSLRMAKRTLQDIAGLSGKNYGYGKSQVGELERQNVLLARQSELLGQELQQRQINFQLATAGFTVGGESPEERAARIKDAKTQAEFAQKQLDIQKKTTGNNIRLFDLTNIRAATDALASIRLLTEGREVNFKTTLAEKNLARLNKIQQNNVTRAGAYLSAVDKGVQLEFQELTKLETAYGKAVQGIAMDTITWFNNAIEGMYSALPSSSRVPSAPHAGNGGAATGALFNTGGGGVGTLTIGEAGDETVAVLRNPRSASLSGSGGGGGVTININHPVVRNDGDINKITQSVIRALNTRTALLGLR